MKIAVLTIAYNEEELKIIGARGIAASMVGQILIEEAVILPEAERANAVVTDYDGVSQYALDLRKPGINTAQASSYLEAEVVRRSNLTNQELSGE